MSKNQGRETRVQREETPRSTYRFCFSCRALWLLPLTNQICSFGIAQFYQILPCSVSASGVELMLWQSVRAILSVLGPHMVIEKVDLK